MGENTFELVFTSAEKAALQEAALLPYPIPYSVYPVSSKHRNLIHKSQCHNGWDWGPCILSFGVYEPIELAIIDEGIIESGTTNLQPLPDSAFDVQINVIFNARVDITLDCKASLALSSQENEISCTTGLNKVHCHLLCKDVQLW